MNYVSKNVIGFNYIGYLYNINLSRKSIEENNNYKFKRFKSLIVLFNFLMRESKNEYMCKRLNFIFNLYYNWCKGYLENKFININELLKKIKESKCLNRETLKNIFTLIQIK